MVYIGGYLPTPHLAIGSRSVNMGTLWSRSQLHVCPRNVSETNLCSYTLCVTPLNHLTVTRSWKRSTWANGDLPYNWLDIRDMGEIFEPLSWQDPRLFWKTDMTSSKVADRRKRRWLPLLHRDSKTLPLLLSTANEVALKAMGTTPKTHINHIQFKFISTG